MAIEMWRPRRRLQHWRPFENLDEWEQRLENMFGPSHAPFLGFRDPWQDAGWTPTVEVFDRDDKLVVNAELPGMSEEDIDVSVENSTLTIKGERKAENEVREEDFYRCERFYGSFFRAIPLPSRVDSEGIEAQYENGILSVTLPKTGEGKPKKIKVAGKKAEEKAKKVD